MSNLWTIFRRELGAYFNSAIAYIFLIVFVLFSNGLFMLTFFQMNKADMRPFFNMLPFVLIVFIPAISMRLWAEDKKGNTFELLLTFPMRPAQLVLGKFFASFVFYAIALVCTFTIPIMIGSVGHADAGPIWSGYLGALLMGGLFLAIGIFISGLCKDQIVAFILTVIFSFAVYFIGSDLVAVFLDGWVSGLGTFVKNYIGLTTHLVGFGKGVIDVKDIVYFVLTTLVFLLLNGLSLEGRYRPKAKLVFSAAVGVSLLSLILANWLLHDLPFGRYDVTEGKFYTISDVSQKVLKSLKVPVQIKLYITPSDSMPSALKTLEREITDKLEELKIASEGKLKYRAVHIESAQDDDALKKTLQSQGVVPFQVESVQRDEVGVKLIYSTLVIEYKEKPQETLPRIVPQTMQDLEYQLLSRIYKMTLEEKPKVAVFAPLKEEELAPDLSRVLTAEGQKDQKTYEDEFKTASQLIRNNGYEMARISLTKDDSIPEKSNLLFMLNPGKLTDRQLYEINRYLYQGGTAVVAAQGFEYSYSRQEGGMEAVPKKLDLSINKLLEKWGVKINDQVLLDENSQVISLSSGQRIGPFALQMPVKFPNQIIVDESMINRAVSITKRIPALFYLWGSALDLAEEVIKNAGLQSTVLFTSTAKSWLMPNDGYTNLTAENTLPPANSSELKKRPLSVMLQGQFTNTFGAEPPAWKTEDAAASTTPAAAENKEEKPSEKKDNPKPGRLIVVGCFKTFTEDLIQNAGNLNLFANLVDGLALGEDLVQIRVKAGMVRDIRKLSSAEKLWYKFFIVLLVPIVLFLVAAARHFIRRKEKEFYLAATKG